MVGSLIDPSERIPETPSPGAGRPHCQAWPPAAWPPPPATGPRPRGAAASWPDRARTRSATAFASASSAWVWPLALAIKRRCSSNKAFASAFIFSASASSCRMRRSRSSVFFRITGHANFRSTKNSAMKTTQVQKNSPKLTSNGEAGPSCSWSTASQPNKTSGIGPRLHNLEQQAEHQRDDGGSFEQHRDDQRGPADFRARFRLPRDRFRGLPADPAQPQAGADDGQPDADAGAQRRIGALGGFHHRLGFRELPGDFLEERKDVHHVPSLTRMGRSDPGSRLPQRPPLLPSGFRREPPPAAIRPAGFPDQPAGDPRRDRKSG